MTSKKRLKKVYKLYALEITTTEACNFRCSYCFEKGTIPNTFNNRDTDLLIKRVNQLLDDPWFKQEYEGLKIILWGGEPTMNMPLCEAIIKAFEDDERVCFFIYTNGSTMDEFIDTLIRVRDKPFMDDKEAKFVVQVSYDGNPINDECRVPRDKDCYSSIIVRNAIQLLYKNKIKFGLKATLSWDHFEWLPLVWEDFHSLYEEFDKSIAYSVTVDYYDVQFNKHAVIIRESILNIARKEILFYKRNEKFLSNIFADNKAICATGKSMATVDTNGSISYCHGCLYSENDFTYTSIFNDNFIGEIKRSHDFFTKHETEPDECKDCPAGLCLRCNVRKYDASKKEKLQDRWFDYASQTELCDYYKMVGKIGTALRLILKEQK